MAISLCLLGAFARDSGTPAATLGTPEAGFSPRRQARKGSKHQSIRSKNESGSARIVYNRWRLFGEGVQRTEVIGMLIEIDPTVDFACKLLLGNPEYPDITIHFLNAILRLPAPIVSVEIVNPIVWKEF
jgi:hypothetical protein